MTLLPCCMSLFFYISYVHKNILLLQWFIFWIRRVWKELSIQNFDILPSNSTSCHTSFWFVCMFSFLLECCILGLCSLSGASFKSVNNILDFCFGWHSLMVSLCHLEHFEIIEAHCMQRNIFQMWCQTLSLWSCSWHSPFTYQDTFSLIS